MVDRWSCGHVSGLLARPRPQALMGTVDRDLIKLTGSRCPLVESGCGAVAVGSAYLFPLLSSGGASLAEP
jgi:hypothetical protein